MKHKTLVRGFAVAGAVALGAGSAWAADLTVVSWGGAYTASQQKAYGEPWEQKTGKKIHWENYNGGLGEVSTQVQSGTVTWDIVDVVPHEARVGCDEGLFAEIPDEYFVKTKDGKSLDDDLMVPRPNKCVAPMIWWSYMMFYDQPAWEGKTAPASIADFFNVGDFPGKRGIHTWPNALIETALVADGVDPQGVYEVMDTEEGIDRAFAVLDNIRDHSVFWSARAKPLELVKSGEASMALAYNGRVGAANLSEGATFVPVWDGQVLEEEWIVVIKGTPNKELAFEFAGYASAPEQLAGQAKYISTGGVAHPEPDCPWCPPPPPPCPPWCPPPTPSFVTESFTVPNSVEDWPVHGRSAEKPWHPMPTPPLPFS